MSFAKLSALYLVASLVSMLQPTAESDGLCRIEALDKL